MVKTPQRKKPNITIISNAKILNELREWADSKGLSMNALINEVLTKNILFYRHISEYGYVTIPSTAYFHMIDMLSKEDLVNLLSRTISETVQTIFVHNNISYTMDNMVKFYFERVGQWSGIYNIFKCYDERDSTKLIFEHKYGIKWSDVLEQSISNLMKDTLNLSSTHKILSNTVILQVDKK